MSEKCYVCEKTTKEIKSPLAPHHLPPINRYFIKTGIFSKKEVLFCKSCGETIDKLFGSENWSWMRKITSEGLSFINKNKGKIINRDLGNVPECKWCKQQSNNPDYFHKCDDCGQDYCNNCENAGECPKCIDERLTKPIIKLLKEKSKKISVSDIAAFIKGDRDEVKEHLEWLYEYGDIDFAGNGRYFILSEEKETPKKATAKKTESVADEIKKFKELLDAGAITQEEFDAKKKELLGL